MKEYISTIIYVCIFSVILEIILPNTKLKKYIATLVSVIVLVVIISPVIDIVKNENVTEVISKTIENVSKSTKPYKDSSYDFSNYNDRVIFTSVKEELEEEIYNSVKGEFSNELKINSVDIKLNTKFEIDKIIVYVKNIYLLGNANSVITYLENKYNIPNNKIEVNSKGE